MSWVLDLSILLCTRYLFAMCIYISSVDYIELPVLLYQVPGIYFNVWYITCCPKSVIGVRSTGGVEDAVQQLYVNQARCNWCVPIVLFI